MRPPICGVCDEDFRDADLTSGAEGGLVTFAETDEDRRLNARFQEPGFCGHPSNMEWFCSRHFQAARRLKHLDLSSAMVKLKSEI